MKNENEIDTYDRIFKETDDDGEVKKPRKNYTAKELKERKFILTFLVQSLICIAIIASIIITKYTNSRMFVSVSSVLSGIYEENITLSDLGDIIERNITSNDALTTFFNIKPEE